MHWLDIKFDIRIRHESVYRFYVKSMHCYCLYIELRILSFAFLMLLFSIDLHYILLYRYYALSYLIGRSVTFVCELSILIGRPATFGCELSTLTGRSVTFVCELFTLTGRSVTFVYELSTVIAI